MTTFFPFIWHTPCWHFLSLLLKRWAFRDVVIIHFFSFSLNLFRIEPLSVQYVLLQTQSGFYSEKCSGHVISKKQKEESPVISSLVLSCCDHRAEAALWMHRQQGSSWEERVAFAARLGKVLCLAWFLLRVSLPHGTLFALGSEGCWGLHVSMEAKTNHCLL